MKFDIEAIVFLSKEKVSIFDLANFFKVDVDTIKEKVNELIEEYKERGINFILEDEYISLRTNPLKGEMIKNFFTPELKLRKLSKSAFEVLAIIAYKGPITKSEIEEIRLSGVDHIIPILLEKKLIESNTRKKSLGNPKLYEVTNEFYSYLGIKSKEELFEIEKSDWLEIRKEENENK